MMTQASTSLVVTRLLIFDGEGSLKAYCDVAIADAFLIKGLRVIERHKGLFVSLPRQQGKNGTWYDSVTALTKQAQAELERVVLEAYHQQQDGTNQKVI